MTERLARQAVIDITTKWELFAAALGFNRVDIVVISKNYSHNVADCLTEVIHGWFRGKGGEVSWENLCEALRDPTVDRKDLAMEIEKKYC